MSREFRFSDYIGLDEAMDMGTDLIDATLKVIADTQATGLASDAKDHTIANLKCAKRRLERLQGEINRRHHG